MLSLRGFLLFVIIATGFVVPVCIGQTDKVLSGRELLRAVRDKDAKNSRPLGGRGNADARATTKHPTATELLDKYTQALDSTESFIGSYELVQEYSHYIPGRLPRLTGAKVYGRGQNRSDGQRIYSQQYRWGDVNAKLRDLPKDTPHYNLRVNDGKILYSHSRTIGDARSSGYVSRHDKGPEKAVFIRSANASILGFFGTDERLDSVLRQAHQIAVRPKTETIGGSECYVIDARTKYGKYSIWLDPEHGYHPVKVNAKATEGDEYSYKKVFSKGQVKLEYLKNVRFEEIDGIWIPMEADRGIHNIVEPESFTKDDTHFKRTKVVLNPDHDKLGSFDDPLENPAQDPELVNGTRMHLVSGIRHTWQDGKVVDPQGREVDLDALKPQEPVSLVGKQLPLLEQFEAKLDSVEVKGKRLLVCFWDMNQRPSRHMVRQLAKRAEGLKEKGVTIVAVQASKVDKSELGAWIKKYQVSFPVGMVQGDEEETRLNWGVKSLPWLILTDSEHVVRAEGFGLDELDEKISEVTREVKIRPAEACESAVDAQYANEKMARILTDPRAEKFKMTWYPGGTSYRENVPVTGGCLRVYHVEMSSVPPRQADGLVSPGAVYGRAEFSDFGRTKFDCGLRKSSDGGESYDVFFIDLNHNETLEENEVLKGEFIRRPNSGIVDCHYGAVSLTLQDQDGPRMHRVFVKRRELGGLGELYLVSHCYMGGRIRLGDKEVDALLFDYNCDGRYDSGQLREGPQGGLGPRGADFDRIGWDEDGDGKIQFTEQRFVGSYTVDGQKVYRIGVSGDGRTAAVLPLEVPMGRLQMLAKNAIVRLVGEVGPINLVITDGVTDVPAGTYWVEYLRIEEPGEDGQVRQVRKSGRYFDEPWQIHPNSVLKIERAMCEVTEADEEKYKARMQKAEAASAGPQARSILGEPLGSLEEFNIELDQEKVKDKPVLLCFWDMNQRPSRHSIRELAKRAQELKEEGVVVVCVQASKVDRKELDKWVKKYEIPFPVGMIEADEEKNRLAWGVKSLPWLILTDRQHIVRAEGFALNELDEKLKQIDGE